MRSSERPLDRLMAPASVAVIGASPDRTKIRGLLLEQVRAGGFEGAIYPVNPGYGEIDGLACHPTIAAIGAPVDLAIVAIPTEGVLDTLSACAEAGVANALVLTSGFAEQGGDAVHVQASMAALARRTGMRICGPNSVGFWSGRSHLAATFSPAVEQKPGREPPTPSRRLVGIVSQSGGMAFAPYDYGRSLGLGFSHIVNTGNEVDLTLSDFFAFMVDDPDTAVIALIVEGIRDPERFLAAARRAAELRKPVVVCKIGRSQAGARAASSHTANMAGWDAAYDAMFRTFGFAVAHDLEELTVLAAAFATCPPANGSRVAIVTVSGGAGALASDSLVAQGLAVPELSAALQARIRHVIPSLGAAQNPVDVTAQGGFSGSLGDALAELVRSDEIDQMLLIASLSSERRVPLDLEALRTIAAEGGKPLLVYTYTRPSQLACRALAEAGLVPCIHLTWTSRAMAALAAFGRLRPAGGDATAPPTSAEALSGRDGFLSEDEATGLLQRAGVPGLRRHIARDAEEAATAAGEIGGPVALKVQSADIPHKTEVGGVRLGLRTEEEVRDAFRAIMEEVGRRASHARIDGILVQEMAGAGTEIIVGTVRDPGFGPVLLVGAGGTTTELHKDVTSRLAPVSVEEAREMLGELRSYPLLTGWRGAPPADVDSLCDLIAKVSQLAVVTRETIREIEINPVLVGPEGRGCRAVDALIRAEPSTESGSAV